MSGILYLEHLTNADLGLLASVAKSEAADFRADPAQVEALLRRPALFDALFRGAPYEALLHASPFLVFVVLVNRVTLDLRDAPFVEEWAGPRQRVPVFDVADLRAFAEDSMRRLFLAELLASYTRVASGTVWQRTRRGWRRHRFSELDPGRMIELLGVVPEAERPAVYRRLGDLALFLTGVFPDYVGERMLPPRERERLRRSLGGRDSGPDSRDPLGAIGLLEQVGRHAYRTAWRATVGSSGGMARALGEMADGFDRARRLLNVLTDRYVFPFREQWFPLG